MPQADRLLNIRDHLFTALETTEAESQDACGMAVCRTPFANCQLPTATPLASCGRTAVRRRRSALLTTYYISPISRSAGLTPTTGKILHKIAAATGVPPRALMQVSDESAGKGRSGKTGRPSPGWFA